MNDAKLSVLPQRYSALQGNIRKRWSDILQSDLRSDLDASDHLLYLALMGLDWRQAFSPIRRPNKLRNGRRPYDSAVRALAIVRASFRDQEWIALFNDLVTSEMLDTLRERLPKVTREMHNHLPDSPYVEASDEAA